MEKEKFTENGLTEAEELEILASANEPTSGPFKSFEELMKHLNSEDNDKGA